MMKIKVCQIIPTLVQGGAEKQMCLLAEHLDRAKFDCEVVVLTHSGPYEARLKAADIPVHMINKRGKLDPFAYRRLTKTLRRIAPDIAHTWLFAGNSYGRSAARLAKVPVIIAGERCVDPWKSRLQFAIDRLQAKYTDAIATNTTAIVDFYAAKGLPHEKFHVIPNAIERPTTPSLTRDDVYQRLGIPPRGRLIGAVGRLWKQKGYRDLIWAGELIRVAYQDVWLIIIGDGPELAMLQHHRDLTGAGEAVRFAGHRSDASELLSGFDVLWNGSLYEGQSNTILEAMARGIPVMATDIPGNRDLVIDNLTGFLYRVGDVETLTRRTNQLLRVERSACQYGAAAKQRAELEFSVEKMVSSYERLYEELHLKKTSKS